MSQIAIPITALLWSGMTLGISLESWVKFKTPSLMKPVGLDVGRTVFSAFHKAQFILLIILIVSGLIASLSPWSWLVVGLIALILVLQSVWIFPILSSIIDAIMAGAKISKSHVHTLYGILEVAKLTLLFYLSLRVSLENL
jgi:hypothetical protein